MALTVEERKVAAAAVKPYHTAAMDALDPLSDDTLENIVECYWHLGGHL